MGVTVAGREPDLDTPLAALPRRASLLNLYTAATIVAGIAALVVATLTIGLGPAIAIPGLPPEIASVAGVAAWVGYGLVGGTRMLRDPGGHVVLTFHLPFIVASMIVGGPVAGAWVAFLATFEARELREAPWYGVLANHASLALAALAGGFVAIAITGTGAAIGFQHDLTLAASAVVGSLVLTVLTAAFAGGVVILRDGLSPRDTAAVLARGMRTTALAETLLGWLMAVAWVAVGWWTPALCTVIVLALWRTARTEALLDHDDLTGVLTARAFALRVAAAADRARRGIEGGAYLFLDLDGFKAVNDGPRSHLVGDQVLAELGRRLRRTVRVTDAVGRRGGDEFVILFTGVRDQAGALRLAERVAEVIAQPYATDDGERTIGVSIGVAMLTPGRRDFEPDVRQRADAAMYEAKAAGGGIRVWIDGDDTGDDDPSTRI
jgi:diguanylate cyclase (GGDEF)-like protein